MSNFSEIELLRQSIVDELENLEELDYLYNDYSDKILQAQKKFKGQKKYLLPENYRYITDSLSNLAKELEKEKTKIRLIRQKARKSEENQLFFIDLSSYYRKTKEKLRIYISILSSLIISSDWQSPSYAHSLFSQAGRQTGNISANINDYKRDVHLDEAIYEKAFLSEYIDGRFKLLTHALLVNSGMAAFSTILNYLQAEGKINGKILIGKNVYFQNKQLVVKSFKDKIIEIEEDKTDKIIAVINKNQPSVVYFDSLTNTKDILLPDLYKIISLLNKSKREVYLLVDNTCLASSFQTYKLVKRPGNLRLVLFESMNKYYQFGLDRVTAGIIVANGKDAVKLFEYRKHCGTNIIDSSVFAFPSPNKKLLEKRLFRHQRNALHLASYIQNHLENNRLIDTITYPSFVNHPSYSWSKNYHFCGSYFSLQFRKKHNQRTLKKILEKIISKSKKENINIIGGTSFGFDITRVYLTASHTQFAQSFIRISAGTENIIQTEKIGKIILKVLIN
jgi:cystathionine beta-lyase/cystathionine gamma-synthase